MPHDLTFALDRANRRIDADGRLHVAVTNISKANVCPYLGREIPDWQSMRLDPERIYMLLRAPDELEKAAASFNNIQLLETHIPVSADDPKRERVVGSTGTDAAFVAPYLQNSLAIWDADAIAAIMSGAKRELSCGYRYTPDMTPGVYGSQTYDGIMRAIVGNHVALVEAGRAGPDVMVGDSKLEIGSMSKRALARSTALDKILAEDAKPTTAAILLALDEAEKECAKDESEEEKKAREEAEAKDKKAKDDADRDDDKDDDDDKEKAKDKRARDKRARDADKRDDDDKEKAMDATLKAVESATITRMNAIRDAERTVRPYVGELAVAMDSAEAVYKFALDAMKIDVTGVHPSAFATILKMQPKPGDAPRRIALDAAPSSDILTMFPDAARLIRA